MTAADLDDLAELRWHWGSAYLVEQLGGRWVAQRRDSHATVSARDPGQLLGLIRDDYRRHPVPRDPRPCLFRPEARSGQELVQEAPGLGGQTEPEVSSRTLHQDLVQLLEFDLGRPPAREVALPRPGLEYQPASLALVRLNEVASCLAHGTAGQEV
jgi:hypothetical protein